MHIISRPDSLEVATACIIAYFFICAAFIGWNGPY